MNGRNKALRFSLAALLLGGILTVLLAPALSSPLAGGEDLPERPQKDRDVKNYLVFATDDRRDFVDTSTADLILVCSLNRKSREVNLVSLYRNIGVDPDGDGVFDRLNRSFNSGGAAALAESVNRLSGLDISSYVRVNMKALAETVDALGGIEVELSAEEAEYMNEYNPELYYKNPNASYILTVPVREGRNTLDGTAAVVYARCRNVGGDITRMARYKTVFRKTAEKALGKSPAELKEAAGILLSDIQTDITGAELAELLGRAPEIRDYSFNFLSVPEEETELTEQENADSVCLVSQEEIKEKINEFLYG